MRSPRLLFVILIPACTAIALPTAPTSVKTSAIITPANTPLDPRLHQTAVKLVLSMGVPERMEANVGTMLDSDKQAMRAQFPNFAPAFFDEWTKRMKSRINIDDMVAVVIRAYEKRFTADELESLLSAQQSIGTSGEGEITPELAQKLKDNATPMQSEIIAGCSAVGANLGGTVGEEIGEEHPEWVHRAKTTGTDQK